MARSVERDSANDEVVSMELPAPPGWKKKFFPGQDKSHKKHEIIFTTPTGEDINNKRKLVQYLKAHPGGPAAFEFDWGTGETPRRSARISGRAKASLLIENEPPKKKRSSVARKRGKETEAEPEVLGEIKEVNNQDAGEDENNDDDMKENQDEKETEGKDAEAEVVSLEEAESGHQLNVVNDNEEHKLEDDDMKENQDEKETADKDAEAAAASSEVAEPGDQSNVVNDAEQHKTIAESEEENLGSNLNEKEPDSSEGNLDENLEGVKQDEKVEQPQLGEKDDINLAETSNTEAPISDEREYELGEKKQKTDQHATEIEGEIKEKAAAAEGDSEKHTETNRNTGVTENGNHRNDVDEVQP